MKDIDLQKLKELAQKATPGPWKIASNCDQAVWTKECVINAVIDNNASFIAAASPDVVLALITDYQDKKEALYGLFLIINKLRDSLSLSKETELQEIVDFAVRHIERLEREADWLAEYSALDECPLKTLGWMDNPEEGKEWCDWHPDPDGNYDCSGDNVECWRRMAREAVEEMQDGN